MKSKLFTKFLQVLLSVIFTMFKRVDLFQKYSRFYGSTVEL